MAIVTFIVSFDFKSIIKSITGSKIHLNEISRHELLKQFTSWVYALSDTCKYNDIDEYYFIKHFTESCCFR